LVDLIVVVFAVKTHFRNYTGSGEEGGDATASLSNFFRPIWAKLGKIWVKFW